MGGWVCELGKWMDGCLDESMYVWMDGWMDGWMKGWVEGEMRMGEYLSMNVWMPVDM
jgi:hypothetical protein